MLSVIFGFHWMTSKMDTKYSCSWIIFYMLFHILMVDSSISHREGRRRTFMDLQLAKSWNHELYSYPPNVFVMSSHQRILVQEFDTICTPVNICLFSMKWKEHDLYYSRIVSKVHSSRCNQGERIRLKKPQLVFGRCHSIDKSACLEPNAIITNLREHFPHFHSRCRVTYQIFNPRFYVTAFGLLLTKTKICNLDKQYKIKGKLKASCKESVTTRNFEFNFHPKSTKLPDNCKQQVASSTPLLRRKRNTNPTTPYFSRPMYTAHVLEEQNAGVVVDTITADDGDPGSAGQIRYSLLASRDGRSQSMFTIDPLSGRISTAQKLDREHIPVHYFTLKATDQGSPALTGEVQLTIYVDDTNDHTPKFENPKYEEKRYEDIPIGTTVSTVRATDGDANANAAITYTIVNPEPPNDAFSIHPTEGSISTRKSLDRETTDRYTLLIRATDGAVLTERRSATTTVEIVLLDRNDNIPQFTKDTYSVSVREDLNPSNRPVILQIKARDLDSGVNGVLRYSITGGNPGETFDINEQSGDLFLQKVLDYESTNSYQLRVRVQDTGSPPRSNSTTVFVQVIDTNDNTPKFYRSSIRETVSESVKTGFSIIRVQAFDSDSGKNAELVYSLDGAPEGMPIGVDSKSGWITTTGPLDRETAAEYKFRVKAQDLGEPPRSTFLSMAVIIIDENDNAPVFDPRYYERAISEETNRGSPVLSVTARDKDSIENARISYSITGGNTNNAFSIMGQMGEGLISVARQLQYKEQNRYVLTVTASDGGGLTDTAEVVINITDANTHRPRFTGSPPYTVRVLENVVIGYKVFTVSATDEDVGENARLIYTMTGSDVFQIDPTSGVISTRKALDREKVSGYVISVTVTDHGKPPLAETTEVQISVDDSNDNVPKFEKSSYTGSVSEKALIGTSVLQIRAVDPDFGDNGNVKYSFAGGNDGDGDFTIDSTLGIVRTAHNLDRELIAAYRLKAFAVDNGAPRRSSSVFIDINVEDENDNAPQFDKPTIELAIAENSPVGSTVGRIQAHDPDVGVNAVVEYSIVGGPDAQYFQIIPAQDGQGAWLKTKTELDYESGKIRYELRVKALSDPLFLVATVLVHVQDQNDNKPKMENFRIILNNFKNKFPIGAIGKVPASDPDVSDKLRYRFVSGNEGNVLHLDRNTGEIRLDSRLMSDVPRNGTLRVEVTDGVNVVRADCSLWVKMVTDPMLFSSITVRLSNMTVTAFLSPLYDLFLNGLATVFQTDRSNIFIFNVQDDTDVKAKVLNVSLSVREAVREGRDVFVSPQDLRERVYLRRETLAQISTMEILPFDDNLCVQEPCLNHEQCLSTLRFGNASNFLTSPAMLFRPIHPVNSYYCSCPKGFSGMEASYLCDTEVNLCYSSPCQNNGTCNQVEGSFSCTCPQGFTGARCEIDLTRRFEGGTCPAPLCGTGTCVPLIKGGFRCEGCPGGADYDQFCRLTTRGFERGSFLVFPALRKRHRFNLDLEFATRSEDGLLLYNGRFNEKHDFIALQLSRGQVTFTFSLGSDMTRLETNLTGPVHDGAWHKVSIRYLNRTVVLAVGEDCDVDLALKYPIQYGSRCAVTATQNLPARCSEMTEMCHRYLDLTGPLQLGGLPSKGAGGRLRGARTYEGCLRRVTVDGTMLDLAKSVYNNGTTAGCAHKHNYCGAVPCRNGGRCRNEWKTYRCECPLQFGGHDCSKVVSPAQSYSGSSYVQYRASLPTVQIPWYNALAFRTTRREGALLMLRLGSDAPIVIALKDGFIEYRHPQKTVRLTGLRVNDGAWHHVSAQWMFNSLRIVLDHGQDQVDFEMGNWVATRSVTQIYVGAEVVNAGSILNGFNGCIKEVVVGNRPDAYLTSPLNEHRTIEGCVRRDRCVDRPCPLNNTQCTPNFDSYTCSCKKGYIGLTCQPICDVTNPCLHGATCRARPDLSRGYECLCTQHHSGPYCGVTTGHPCPDAWWGHPICGPCDCDKDKGFNPSCDKKTGACSCRTNYYRVGSVCLPCECDPVGTVPGLACDPVTGQCPCRSGGTGRRCTQCISKYAQVTARGCEAVFEACPRNYNSRIWWNTTAYGQWVRVPCPNDAKGTATRYCARETLWSEADTFSCTSLNYLLLNDSLHHISLGTQQLDTYMVVTLADHLEKATRQTATLYGNDLNITYRALRTVLQYEGRQTGLNLTHTRDSGFIKNLLSSLDRVLTAKYQPLWRHLAGEGGVSALVREMENYVTTLAKNMESTLIPPFDVVAGDIFLGVDKIARDLGNSTLVPKYNNKVQPPHLFDPDSRVRLPLAAYGGTGREDFLATGAGNRDAYVGYVFYGKLGEVLPDQYNNTIRRVPGVPLAVSAPAVTLRLIADNRLVEGPLAAPLVLNLRQLTRSNRTSPQCVYWRYTDGTDGQWDTEGCRLEGVYEKGEHRYVTCECDHMTTFSVIMDVSDVEHLYAVPVEVQAVTYVALTSACVVLLLGMIVLMFLRRLDSNINSIHVNLMLTCFTWMITYMLGVNATQPEIVCRMVSIVLHFFLLSVFAWLFVECLHLYRMMAELRDVNTGTMKFYYVLGYVIPGIIVGLAVGLDTDSYGNSRFCMLSIYEPIIWSFIGPVVILSVMVVVTFIMAVRTTFTVKSDDDRHLYRMNLLAVLIVAPLALLAWVFALLAVNTDDPRSDRQIHVAFHYFVAFVCLLLAVFLLLGHVVLNPRTRYEIKRCWAVMRGEKDAEGLDDSTNSQGRNQSRSALTYHQETVDPMARFNMAISTESTTSRSTSKTSSGGYRDGYTGRSGTTSSGPSDYQNPAYTGYDSSYFHDKPVRQEDPDTGERRHRGRKKRRDSDSDSDLSLGRASIELASSHSSDDDDDDINWADVTAPKPKALERVKAQSRPTSKVPVPPVRSDSIPPGHCNQGYSPSTNSDSDPSKDAPRGPGAPRAPEQVRVQIRPRQSLGPAPGGPPLGPKEPPLKAGYEAPLRVALEEKGSMERLNESMRDLDTTVSSIRSRDMPPLGAPKRPPTYEMATRAGTPGSGAPSPRAKSPPGLPARSFSPAMTSQLAQPIRGGDTRPALTLTSDAMIDDETRV